MVSMKTNLYRCFLELVLLFAAALCVLAVTPRQNTSAGNETAEGTVQTTDLLRPEAWKSPDETRWQFEGGRLRGRTFAFPEVATSDPEATANLVSKNSFGGEQLSLATDMVFERSRYLGVYIDYDPETDTGIWMATGHPLSEADVDANREAPMAYIKTVDEGHWKVRAKGELVFELGELLRLRWVKDGPDYQVWQDDRLVATYRPKRKYDPGHIRLRLVSAVFEVHKLEMTSGSVE
jgi:hypothetical protein